jgi:alanine racemase
MKPVHSTVAEINLDAFVHNVKEIRRVVGKGVELIPVVKSDAYGHGLLPLAGVLKTLGIKILGVGLSEEGERLRKHGIDLDVLLLDGMLDGDIPRVVEHDLIPVITSVSQVKKLSKAAKRKNIRIHVKVNTGMNRLGLPSQKALHFFKEVRRLKNIEVDGLMTHFACADDPANPLTKRQILMFNQVQKLLCKNGVEIPRIHSANSAAILHFPASHYTAVRPGIALYGYLPFKSDKVKLKPVMNLTARIIEIQEIRKGEGVGYGWCGYRAATPRRIGVLTAGYAHGISRALSNRCQAIVRGKWAAQVGTICMDSLMVDLTENPDAKIGDPAILIGSENGKRISASDWAEKVGTIPYEILTGISARIPRVYLQGNRVSPVSDRI